MFHRLQIFKEHGRVKMFCSQSGFSREEEFYLYDQKVGTGLNGKMKFNPLGYFLRLANTRMHEENKYFFQGETKNLCEKIVETTHMKMEVFDWLPTFDDLEKAEMTHCPYQTRLPFDVDSFKKMSRSVHWTGSGTFLRFVTGQVLAAVTRW